MGHDCPPSIEGARPSLSPPQREKRGRGKGKNFQQKSGEKLSWPLLLKAVVSACPGQEEIVILDLGILRIYFALLNLMELQADSSDTFILLRQEDFIIVSLTRRYNLELF